MATVSILNTDAQLSSKTVPLLESAGTVTGLWTFDRDPNAPFAVTASSAVVTNLDADLWDGFHSTTYTGASTIVTLGTITTGIWNAGAVTSSGAGTFAGLLTVTKTGSVATLGGAFAGSNVIALNNANAGTTGLIRLQLGTDTINNLLLTAYGSGFTSTGHTQADGVSLISQGVGGLYILASHASGVIALYAGGTTRRMLINTTGIVTMDYYGAGTATFSAAGVISSVSDERLKDDIRPLDYGLAEVLALEPIRYFWTDASGLNDPAHTEYGGFSAANIKAAMPLAVGTDKGGFLTLGDRPILGAVVNSVKELNTRLAALEARVH